MLTAYKMLFACASAACVLAVTPASAAVVVSDRLTTSGTDDIFFNFTGGAFSVQVGPQATNGLAAPEIYLFRDDGSSGALTGDRLGHDDSGASGGIASISRNLASGYYVLAVGTHNFTEVEARAGVADFDMGQRRFTATFSDGVAITNGPVPEPATWGLMLLGFGLVGGAMRYRRARTGVSFA